MEAAAIPPKYGNHLPNYTVPYAEDNFSQMLQHPNPQRKKANLFYYA
jgi:hypothetical protein